MCLAIPGKITNISSDDPLLRMGDISFGGITKQASLAFVPEANVNDYVLVHAGIAINIIKESEAKKTFEYIREIEEVDQ